MKLLSDKHLLCDTEVKSIDTVKHKQPIIGSVIERGSWNEFKEMVEFYGRDVVIDNVKKARSFSGKTMYSIGGYFDIPIENRNYYTHKQFYQIPYL
jgi:hypothetical protein